MRIGAHESVAGGLSLAFERALADGAEALQIFTKSSRQWAAKELTDEDVQAFRAAHTASGLPVIVHDSYLINLGSEPGDIRTKSLDAFRDELERCERLGVRWLVAHPGAHADETTGLRLIAEGIRASLEATAGCQVGVLLEITAGQGTNLGYRFAHLQTLLELIDQPERTGVCLDTCHLYAAGYDIATDEGYAATMAELDATVGASRVKALHLNDAKKGLSSRVDRHEFIGEGTLGLGTFRRFVRDSRFTAVPGVLETPEGKWKHEIAVLKALRDGTPLPVDVAASPDTTPEKPPKPVKPAKTKTTSHRATPTKKTRPDAPAKKTATSATSKSKASSPAKRGSSPATRTSGRATSHR